MDAEAPQRSGPRPWLLIALGVAVIALVASMMWRGGSASTDMPASSQNAGGRPSGQLVAIDPAQLEVRLEALEAERPAPGEAGRNPFRFQPKAAPPTGRPAATQPQAPPTLENAPPTGPPPAPPIPLKFIGIIDAGGVRIAALSDCKAATFQHREGEIIDGRYRLVKIGLESVVIEHLDGRGRETIRMTGDCPPR